eukprot:865927-Pyramimonas_sp.AAC.1
MIATVFHGSKTASEEAEGEGGALTDPEGDARCQCDSKVKKNTRSQSQKEIGAEVWNAKDKKQFLQAIAL